VNDMNSRHIRNSATLFALVATAMPLAAHAYVGPGAGLGLLAALWGLVAAVGVAVFYVVMWPIRRMRRRRKAEQIAAAGRPDAQPITEPKSNRDFPHS
jgi:type VI protein secretion system component VasK